MTVRTFTFNDAVSIFSLMRLIDRIATYCLLVVELVMQVADLSAESGKVNLLEKMVADLTIELSMMNSASNDHRRLDHNASLGSIYEFPQMGGGPIYSAGSHPYISTFASGQRPVLPGSGEKGRPTYYMNAVNPMQGIIILHLFLPSSMDHNYAVRIPYL